MHPQDARERLATADQHSVTARGGKAIRALRNDVELESGGYLSLSR
jgi:hypothetical protein